VPLIERALAALKRIVIVIVIAIAFSIGLLGAIVLSLHSSQTTVPSIVGKDRAEAEEAITAARLNFRVRAMRPASDAKPDTVLIQIPGAGEEVKVGQTVAVDISRPAKEGETPASATTDNSIETKSGSGNTNESASSSNANETKPKRNKNTNKNANDNQNANDNRNRATNSNTNRAATDNQKLSPTGPQDNTSGNSDTRRAGANNNRGNSNSNANRRRPLASPTP